MGKVIKNEEKRRIYLKLSGDIGWNEICEIKREVEEAVKTIRKPFYLLVDTEKIGRVSSDASIELNKGREYMINNGIKYSAIVRGNPFSEAVSMAALINLRNRGIHYEQRYFDSFDEAENFLDLMLWAEESGTSSIGLIAV